MVGESSNVYSELIHVLRYNVQDGMLDIHYHTWNAVMRSVTGSLWHDWAESIEVGVRTNFDETI